MEGLSPDPAAWGVLTGFRDATGGWRTASAATVAAVLDALGADAERPADDGRVQVVRSGRRPRLARPATVVLEDGTDLGVATGRLPAGLPPGYHRLVREDGGSTRLIVSPGRCHLPAGLRTWGWAAQLYALRSARSWGMGDLGDLAGLARRSAAELGAGMVLVNPLHAVAPGEPQQPSPYFPSSRLYRNPLYLRVEEVPGAAALGARLDALAAAGRELNRRRLIDRDAVHRLKTEALEEIWAGFAGDPGFDAYRATEGEQLERFATWCALAEVHGGRWQDWPEALRRPDTAEVAGFRAEHRRRIDHHAWLQWLLDRQLAAASEPLSLMHDLAIGVDPGGADAWSWQEILASGVRVGAPPDEFNAAGQDWGLPPFHPWRLRRAGYEPFAATIRAALRHAAALRVDHVMGLFRLFWIPAGLGPADGAYVRYPHGELLDVLALESARAGAYVCGEDLGTVEDTVRTEMAERRMLSYRLLWFETDPPERYPRRALSAITTHDLPTVAGMWTGSDIDDQRSAGVEPNLESTNAIRDRIGALTGLGAGAPVDMAVEALHARLAQAPSALVTATLDDCLGVTERPNMPATTDTWPNWCLALPAPLEAVLDDPRTRRVAGLLNRGRSASGRTGSGRSAGPARPGDAP
ncbi:MAG: 4-alpha-glucanotransferase [Chloroflexi bacterium]|nr:MAG: 4-alpha-glucanotransferase [Chloroflexota bacterium]